MKTSRGEFMMSACPPWCIGQHEESWDEGCDQQSASEHLGPEFDAHLSGLTNHYSGDVLREGGGHYLLRLFAPTALVRGVPVPGMPLISLDVSFGRSAGQREAQATVRLTTGEARSMAAQLLALADAEELS